MSSNLSEKVGNIVSSLERFADPERKEKAKSYYPTAMEVIGVTNPNIKKVLTEVKKETKNWTERQKIDLAIELVETGIFECQHLAYEWIGRSKKTLKELTKKDLKAMAKNLDNWVSVDTFSGYLAGYCWREGILSTDEIKSHMKSDDVWQRRIALVSTVALNQKARGGTGDPKRTLEICEMAIDDHEDMINKALSWALRELSKVDKEPVIKFMEKHKDRLHSRVRREVWRKLETGLKNP